MNLETSHTISPRAPRTSLQRRWIHRVLSIVGLLCLVGLAFACFDGALHFEMSSCPNETTVYLWVAGSVYSVWFLIALVEMVSSPKSTIITIFAMTLCVFSIVIGILGIISSAQIGCARRQPQVFSLTIATASSNIAICIPLLGVMVHYTIGATESSKAYTSGLLSILRCSCLSHTLRRFVAVIPFVVLTGVSLGLYISHGNDTCAQPLGLHLIITCVCFVLAPCLALWCYFRSSSQSTALALPYLLCGYSILCLSWAIVGTFWVRKVTGNTTSCTSELSISVHFTRLSLFFVGTLILCLTCCCKIERICLPLILPQDCIVIQSSHQVI